MAIEKRITVNHKIEEVFQAFLHEFDKWWPDEYTWSQNKLEKIVLGCSSGDMCTEFGPFGFRCDWGRVLELEPNRVIRFTWQISPKREPVPDPDKSSEIMVRFNSHKEGTEVLLSHHHFENHGDGFESYEEAMNSKYGWEYILSKFKSHLDAI